MSKPQQIRDHIAYFLQEAVKAYEIDGVCDRLGMPVVADGAKPRIVVSDALNNTIDIVEGAERCLVYDRPLPPDGLTWTELLSWWASIQSITDDRAAATALYKRLFSSLASPPEELLFRTYCERYADGSADVPALIPQVYLHYNPYTARELAAMNATQLPRQRMDFLLLPGERTRVVIEVDGKQHYSTDDGIASPSLYADMVREDRRIRLGGYEVFRFGGAELQGKAGEQLVRGFFDELLRRTKP